MPDEDSSQSAPSDASPIETVETPVSPEPAPTPDQSAVSEPAMVAEPVVVETPPIVQPPAEAPVEASIDVPTEAPIEIEQPVETTPEVSTEQPVVPPSNIPSSTPAVVTAPTLDRSSWTYLKSLIPLSLAERRRRRQAHIERLIDHAAKKGSVSRRDAQLLLEISGATADRYLRELLSQGRIARENDGRYTEYRFVR